jgi:hypothetical protein
MAGFDPFSGNSQSPNNPFNLAQNYGNADYDVRHYISANYVFTVPHWRGPRFLVDGWQFSGTVFHSTGLPFSATDSGTASAFSNYGDSDGIARFKNEKICSRSSRWKLSLPSLF